MAVIVSLRTDPAGNIAASVEGQLFGAPVARSSLPDLPALQADAYTAGRKLMSALGGAALLERLDADSEKLLLLDLDQRAEEVAWEYAALPDQQLFLGVRYGLLRLVNQAAPPLPPPGPIHFLALGADPLVDEDGNPPNDHLPIDVELAQLQSVLAESGADIRAERVPPTLEHLGDALSPATHATILHLTCHGSVIETKAGLLAILVMEDTNGSPDALNGDLLTGMAAEGVLRLVMLSACRTAHGTTANLAHALVRNGVPFAIGMQGDFPAHLSDRLAQGFYRPALAGHPLAVALRMARVALARESSAVGLLVGYAARDGWRPLPRQNGAVVGGLGLAWRAALPPEVQPPRPLLGRDRELHALAALYSAGTKVVTVSGTGGMGKTALAAAFVERFGWRWPAGVAVVSFASDRVEGRAFRLSLLDLLGGKTEATRYADDEADAQAGRVLALARDWGGLLVVDNYESVLQRLEPEAKDDERAQAEAVHHLLAQLADGGLRLLLTSRHQPAGFSGERLFPGADEALPGLEAEPGVALFFRHCSKANPKEPADRQLARDVWQASGGHPLAVTLLAGEYAESAVGPAEFLKNWPAELAAARQPGLSRHQQSFATAFARSYDRLGSELQSRLLALSIFPFPFYVEGAVLAWGLATDEAGIAVAREALGALARRNLLEEDGRYKDDMPSAYRFQPALYREIVRRAGERGRNAGKASYAAYGAWLARYGYGDMHREPALARRCQLGMDAMDAAVETLAGTDRLWHIRRLAWIKGAFGGNRPAFELLRRVLPEGAPLPDPKKDPEAAKVDSSLRYELAHLAAVFGDLDGAMRLYQDSLKLDEQLGDLKGKSATLHAMAGIFVTRGDLDGAMRLYQDSLKLDEQLGDLQGKSATLHAMAGIFVTRGDLDGAMRLYQDSLKLKEQVGDLQGRSATQAQMAHVYVTRGDLDRAMRLYQEALTNLEQVGDLKSKSATLHAMAGIFVTRGDLDGAMRLYQDSLKLKEQVGDLQGRSATQAQMAHVYVTRGDLDRAMRLYQEALTNLEQVGDPKGQSATLGEIANVYMAQQKWRDAEVVLKEALNIARKLGQPEGIAFNSVKLGQVAQANGQRETSLARYSEGLAIFERLGMPSETAQVREMIAALEAGPGPDQGPLAQAIGRARQAKEQGDIETAIAAQEQAVALARALGEERDAQVTLSVQLYNLAGYYADAERHADAVRAFEEVVALDLRTGHEDLESDRHALEEARRLAALSPEERQRLRAAREPPERPAEAAPDDPLEWAISEVAKALARGDLDTALPAQKQVVALARERGETPEVLDVLRIQLKRLADLCLQAGRVSDAVTAYAEVVSVDERLSHADLAADRRGLERLKEIAGIPEEEQQAELAGMAAASRRAQIEDLTGQARDAAIAVRRGEASVEEVVPQFEQVAAQIEADEKPDSAWREAAAFLRVLVALLSGQPLPPVPAAYAGHLAAVQSAGSARPAGSAGDALPISASPD